MNIIGLYTITNTVNGKRYVGSSINIKRRWAQHKAKLRHEKHSNPYLQNAWNTYGEGGFLFEIIIITDAQHIHYYEQALIDSGNYEYNISKDALAPMAGRHHSEETKKLLKQLNGGENNYNYGRAFSEQTRQKMSRAKKGKPLSQEHKAKISKANKNRVFTKEHRRKLAAAQTGRVYTPETKEKISRNHADVSGSNNPFYGRKHTEEAKEKNSRAHIGENNRLYGKKRSDKTKGKISKALTGHSVSEETRNKIRLSLKSYHENKNK